MKKIFDYLSSHLSGKRYAHTMAVTELAVSLAKFYKLDIFKCEMAALLHDCAKNMSLEEMKKYIYKNRLKIKNCNFIVEHLPQVLHSYIGADIAKRKFAIKDKEILNAICNHTVGRTCMSDYEKVLFLADALSADRKYDKSFVPKKVLFGDMNTAFKLVLQNKIKYVVANFSVLHPDIIKIWNYYNL
ncbi:MAG: bis(5'-nucleosyl)-tetraphosphatase (symmetrical) YqeK, partial [Elusimicrobia bacterium]|nr:bis(5'-nucleosyl)-tetraphosphatase (symmetrical) YqeK [Elusimicrobiota bacterium]